MDPAPDVAYSFAEIVNSMQEEFSTVSDDEDEDSFNHKHSTSTSRIEKNLNEKYNDRVTSIYLDDDGWPLSYCYSTEGGAFPEIKLLNPITYIRNVRASMIDAHVTSEWLHLRHDEQDKLYTILQAGISIWKRVIFNWHGRDDEFDICSSDGREGGQWTLRTEPYGKEEIFSQLKTYGVQSLQLNTNVLGTLARGRSKSEMRKLVERIKMQNVGHNSLEDAWEMAMISGFGNGSGQYAIMMLLDSIVGLFCGLNVERPLPHITVLNITSSSTSERGDASSVTSCSSSESESCSSPPLSAKRRRHDNIEQCTTSPKRKELKNVTWPAHNCMFVDLKVASFDGAHNTTKYLLLVRIHSHSQGAKNSPKTQKKFVKDLIHALQFQNEIFGLFIDTKQITMYNVKRSPNSKITVMEAIYDMIEETKQFQFSFSVSKFQKLVLDIFSCILHGIRHIDV